MEGLNFLSDVTPANITEQAQQAGLNTFKYIMGLLEPFKWYIIGLVIAIGLIFIVKTIAAKLVILAAVVLFVFAFCTQPQFLEKEKLTFSTNIKEDVRSATDGIISMFSQ